MYYEDEGRRFNVLSGLIFGTALGISTALLLGPGRRGARRVRDRFPKGAKGSLDSVTAAGRKRLNL